MALLLLVGRVLAREIRRRDRAEHALRSGEKRLRLALQAGRMVAWEIDPFTGAISRTENARGLMGPRYESAEAFLENVHPDDRDRVAAALLEAKAGRPVGLEYRYIRANGDVLWLEVRADQVGEEDGPRTVSGVTFDITERRRIEEDLRLAKEAAERAQAQAESGSRAKSEFLAVMSHEIRTPLNSIMGFTDLLLSRIELSPEVRRHLSLIRAAGSALLTVVNDVLDFSKIEAGAVELELGPFSPREVAEDCVSIVRDLAEQKGLEVAVAIDSTVLPRALGDQHRLRQILLNLLNNAVKFTETGRIVLEVTARDGAPGLTFAVRDTGIGIAAEKQPLLFQRFSQVDGSYSRSHGGTGLGLAICKHLVTLMGGEIGVESEAGRGSTFRFSIPAVPVEDHGEERAEPVLPPASAARPARILLVDDAEINLEIARAVLEGAGHRVDVARHGAQALAAVQESAYDIVLMDVQMPVMDGVAATRMIRDLKGPARDVPIIAMTANVYAEQVAHFLSAGMSGHVGKPFDRAELLGAVAAWARQDGRKIALPPAA
jgi:signal transduction histidine kinase/ActR/RegA family two-component response regulator